MTIRSEHDFDSTPTDQSFLKNIVSSIGKYLIIATVCEIILAAVNPLWSHEVHSNYILVVGFRIAALSNPLVQKKNLWMVWKSIFNIGRRPVSYSNNFIVFATEESLHNNIIALVYVYNAISTPTTAVIFQIVLSIYQITL